MSVTGLFHQHNGSIPFRPNSVHIPCQKWLSRSKRYFRETYIPEVCKRTYIWLGTSIYTWFWKKIMLIYLWIFRQLLALQYFDSSEQSATSRFWWNEERIEAESGSRVISDRGQRVSEFPEVGSHQSEREHNMSMRNLKDGWTGKRWTSSKSRRTYKFDCMKFRTCYSENDEVAGNLYSPINLSYLVWENSNKDYCGAVSKPILCSLLINYFIP